MDNSQRVVLRLIVALSGIVDSSAAPRGHDERKRVVGSGVEQGDVDGRPHGPRRRPRAGDHVDDRLEPVHGAPTALRTLVVEILPDVALSHDGSVRWRCPSRARRR